MTLPDSGKGGLLAVNGLTKGYVHLGLTSPIFWVVELGCLQKQLQVLDVPFNGLAVQVLVDSVANPKMIPQVTIHLA